VGKAIHVARAEDKAAAKLKRILPEFVLMMTCGARAFAACGVITPKKMQKVCRAKSGGTVGTALFVDQQRKRDAGFLAEHARIVTVTQPDRGQRGSFAAEGLFAFAQLRDVLATEDSSVVPQKNDHGRRGGPERTKSHFTPVGIGDHNLCESFAERLLHDGSILVIASLAVKRRLTLVSRWWQTAQFMDARCDIACLHLSA
jgi:hypothetical protein